MFTQDLRYAFRSLLKRPGFTTIAVITLSLGIGATTAIFSVADAVLLRPLEYANADRLIKLRGMSKKTGEISNLAPADFLDFSRDAKTVEQIGANGFVGLFTIGGGQGDAERVGGVNVTAGFFPTLGVQPAIGRMFQAEEDTPSAETVVMLSDGFWRRRFGADPSIVGKTITLNAEPVTVIGVLPASYRHVEPNPERPADVFTLFGFDPANANRGGHFIRGVARLKDGVTFEQAKAEFETIAARLQTQFPASNVDQGVYVTSLLESIVGDSRPVITLLAAAVGVVLLVACANVANLLLARGTGRLRELALRAAIGADRGRLVRQMLTESLALSVMGAAGGLLLAFFATRALTLLAETGMTRADQVHLDAPALLFAVVAAVATSMAFGLVPALQLSKQDLNDALKDGGRQQGAAVGKRAREWLLAAEVAVSLMLLVGAGLLIRSLWQLQQVNPGFVADNVLAMEVSLPVARYPEGTQMPFYQQLEERVHALPGVAATGAVNILPLSNNYDSRGIQVEDNPKPEGQGFAPQSRSATPGYFKAMGIPLLAGRNFDAHDTDDGQLVVIISEAMARSYWPPSAEATGNTPLASVIGKRITYNSGIPRERQQVVGGPGSRIVIGVVGNVKHLGLDEQDVPMFYTPHTQQPSYHTMRLVIRANADAATLTRSIREQLSQMDREVPLSQVATLSTTLDKTTAAPRARARLLGIFAALAMVLAAIGVYGVVAYMVGQRSQEIGVRRALGANAAAVISMLLREAMRTVVIGIAIGIAGAFAMTKLIAAMLFEVSATDVMTYVVACALLALSALIASIVPARKALAVDPISAVRSQ